MIEKPFESSAFFIVLNLLPLSMDLVNNKELQLTINGAFQLKKFPAIENYLGYQIPFKAMTINTSGKLYFETILN